MDDLDADDLDYWRLCDELSIREAALLIAGVCPARNSEVENWETHQRPKGYEAAKSAITNALRSNKIEGNFEPEWGTDFNGNEHPIEGSVGLDNSRINVESLKSWLLTRGFCRGFFFPAGVETQDYLNPSDPRYAPKLAAAVSAWRAVNDPGGKHPKQALAKWLRENAADFGLTDEEGKPNETGIEEAAKVANWRPGGGAPRTP